AFIIRRESGGAAEGPEGIEQPALLLVGLPKGTPGAVTGGVFAGDAFQLADRRARFAQGHEYLAQPGARVREGGVEVERSLQAAEGFGMTAGQPAGAADALPGGGGVGGEFLGAREEGIHRVRPALMVTAGGKGRVWPPVVRCELDSGFIMICRRIHPPAAFQEASEG